MSIKCAFCTTASTSPFCKLSDLTTRQLISNRKIVIYFKFSVLGIRGPTNKQKHSGGGGGGGVLDVLICSVIYSVVILTVEIFLYRLTAVHGLPCG